LGRAGCEAKSGIVRGTFGERGEAGASTGPGMNSAVKDKTKPLFVGT
jgi:hypothetical protein